jgi:hypothetical protein
MGTISTSPLSGLSRWRTTPRNIERTAAKRPDYLDITYEEIRERERETYDDKGGVGDVVQQCCSPFIQLVPQFVVIFP